MVDFTRAWGDFTRAWGDFIRDFVRARGLHKKHAHKAPEKKQQQESGLI